MVIHLVRCQDNYIEGGGGGGVNNASNATKIRKKNTWHVELNYIVQPLKNVIIIVNRLRYEDNNFARGRGSIPLHGPHKFSLQVT